MIQVPTPPAGVLELIEGAIQHEIRAYVLNGGNRDFRHEDKQDAAKDWIAAVTNAMRQEDAS